ncbi:MAG: cysteine hydrolase [Clostridia bacterium]|nr:cysteine hydrolase [Clostridia bacterium]
MNKLLLIIDVQNSFINQNTMFLLDKINNLIAEEKYNNIVFTRFINDENNMCYKKLKYTGCIKEEERRISIETRGKKVIDKSTYTALNEELIKYLCENNINEIYLCGIDTECCVLKTALDMFEKGYNIYILKDYCACTHGIERHNNAIKILERNIGKKFII